MAQKKVVWSETAIKQRRDVLQYWARRNNTITYSVKLIKIIRKNIRVIQKYPYAFKKTIYPETRVMSFDYYSLLYRLTQDQIIITAFWDNRQDPSKLIEIISKGNNSQL